MSDAWTLKINGPVGAWAAVSGGRLWGALESMPMPADAQSPTSVNAYRVAYRWWFEGAWRRSDKWVAIPMWVLVAGCVGTTLLGRRACSRAQRRVAGGLCPVCGYDRSGVANTLNCPECGVHAKAH